MIRLTNGHHYQHIWRWRLGTWYAHDNHLYRVGDGYPLGYEKIQSPRWKNVTDRQDNLHLERYRNES